VQVFSNPDPGIAGRIQVVLAEKRKAKGLRHFYHDGFTFSYAYL